MDQKKDLIIDGHSDIPNHLLMRRGETRLMEEEHLPLLKEVGVDLLIANIYTSSPDSSLLDGLLEIMLFKNQLREIEECEIVTSVKEMERVLEKGQLGFFLSLEGLEPLAGEIHLLEVFYELGVRFASLTWNHKNPFASGAMNKGGVTPLGREILKRMEDLGMVLDLSHLNEEGFWDALEFFKGPLFASHSNAFTLYPFPRNLKDDQLIALKERGGLVGLNNYMTHENSTFDTFMDQLLYLIMLLGEDYVALGLDFNGYLGLPETPGMEDPRCIPGIKESMEERGLSRKSIQKVMGENLYHFFQRFLP